MTPGLTKQMGDFEDGNLHRQRWLVRCVPRNLDRVEQFLVTRVYKTLSVELMLSDCQG